MTTWKFCLINYKREKIKDGEYNSNKQLLQVKKKQDLCSFAGSSHHYSADTKEIPSK